MSNLAQPKRLHRLEGHADDVWGTAFSPDGALVATASKDKTARIWNAQTGKQIGASRQHPHAVFGVAFDPNGKRMVTGAWDGSRAYGTWRKAGRRLSLGDISAM